MELNKENIKSEINRMIDKVNENKKRPEKLCIIMHPNQINQFENSTEDLDLKEELTIYNIEDLMLIKDEDMINDYQNKMLIQEDKGLKYFQDILSFAQMVKLI